MPILGFGFVRLLEKQNRKNVLACMFVLLRVTNQKDLFCPSPFWLKASATSKTGKTCTFFFLPMSSLLAPLRRGHDFTAKETNVAEFLRESTGAESLEGFFYGKPCYIALEYATETRADSASSGIRAPRRECHHGR